MKKKVLLAAAASSFTLVGANAFAASTTTTFGVSATVVDSCSVSATNMAFGNIDPLVNATTATDATSTITVTCANGTAYNVGLDAGTATGATVTTRQMTSGTDTLNYALYRDSARTSNWGATIGTDTVAGTGSGAGQDLTVYGRIPSGQEAAPTGAYSDTITVTVSY